MANRIFIDTMTATVGDADDLLIFDADYVPFDLVDQADSDIVEWAKENEDLADAP